MPRPALPSCTTRRPHPGSAGQASSLIAFDTFRLPPLSSSSDGIWIFECTGRKRPLAFQGHRRAPWPLSSRFSREGRPNLRSLPSHPAQYFTIRTRSSPHATTQPRKPVPVPVPTRALEAPSSSPRPGLSASYPYQYQVQPRQSASICLSVFRHPPPETSCSFTSYSLPARTHIHKLGLARHQQISPLGQRSMPVLLYTSSASLALSLRAGESTSTVRPFVRSFVRSFLRSSVRARLLGFRRCIRWRRKGFLYII